MARLSRPAQFRAEGMVLPWRSISDLQHEGREVPNDLAASRKRSVEGGHTEVHLRWGCEPTIGVPMTPFEVWMRPINSRAERVSTQWFSTNDNELKASLPAAASLVSIELQRANQTAPVAVYGLRGEGDLRRTLAAKSIRVSNNNRFTITLRGDGITGLLILNGFNPVVRIQRISDTINDPEWKLVERVGLPVDGTWGTNSYSPVDQGIIGAELEPMKAAMERLQRGAPPFGWPLVTQANQVAPQWEPVVPEKLIDELYADLMPMLEPCFAGVLSSHQIKIRPVLDVDPPQQGGRQSSAKTTAALSPIQLLLLAATTEPALALACGFGTAWSLEPSPIEGLSPGKVEFMVTGSWKGHPELGDMELASYIPWPENHVQLMKPVRFVAQRDGLVRPQATDAHWRESVRVRWNRVENTASLGRPTSCGFARYDNTTTPQSLSLMPKRDAGGWRPFVITPDGSEDQPNNDKNALIDAAVALPLDGSTRQLGYAVTVQDVFGVWSSWSDALHSGRAPMAPGLGVISAQLDTRYSGSVSACPSELDLHVAIDWSSRRPRRFELHMGFYPMADADSPVPLTLTPGAPAPSGMFKRQLTVTFNGDNPNPGSPNIRALDADGLRFVIAGPQQGMDTRRYRIALPVPELDFSSTRRWGVRIWGRLESLVVPGYSQWGPPNGADGTTPAVAIAVAASPAPVTPMPLPSLPGVPMGSQPDGNGRSHVKINWSLPSVARPEKINVWEITESVIRQRESLAVPDSRTAPGARLLELRNVYDALSQDDRRLGFRRLMELPGEAREIDIALPKGSTDIHFYTITTTTDTGIESPWPDGTAEERLHAFIAPTLVSPAAPLVRSSIASSGTVSLDLVSTSAIAVSEFRLYRSRSLEAVRRIGSMGPPFAIVSAIAPAAMDEPDPDTGQPQWRASWSGAFPVGWQDWLVRAVSVPVESVPDAALRGQVSLSSDVVALAVRPQTPPDLEPLIHSDWGATHNGVLVESFTSLHFTDSTSGPHRMIATVGDNHIVFDDINEIPIDTSSIPAGAGPGPVLVRGERVAGRTPLALWFERADRLQEMDVSLKLIDPRGRTTHENITVPPWIEQRLNVKILDVFTISGRGKVVNFSADAPIDSRNPGELTVTVSPARFSNILRPTITASFVLHKIPFSARPSLTGGADKILISRTTNNSPHAYSLFVRSGNDQSVLINIEMNDGRKGSARHEPRPVIGRPVPGNPFDPPVIPIPPRR